MDDIKKLVNREKKKRERKIIKESDCKIDDQYYRLRLVKMDGLLLEYMENQTPEICRVAVKQNKLAIRFVRNLSMLELETEESAVGDEKAKYFSFLDKFRDSGEKIFGRPFFYYRSILREEFPELGRKEAHKVINSWAKN